MRFILLLVAIVFATQSFCQDTFSIVAVDLQTGQVGSAGATCLDDDDIAGGALIISDVIPDVGAIHTQSYWMFQNQTAAHEQMVDEGLSPEELMTWLEENDATGAPWIRQYGAVDLVTGEARAAAFTGDQCEDYKSHIVGDNYAIQGNILLDETILPAMEDGFVNTDGSLAEKLMAALQGANVPGADSRCLDEGVSSRSAFLRVACPGDDPFDLCVDLLVSWTPEGVEPIDSLQSIFDQSLNVNDINIQSSFNLYPNPSRDNVNILIPHRYQANELGIQVYSHTGALVYENSIQNTLSANVPLSSPGMYSIIVQRGNTTLYREQVVVID